MAATKPTHTIVLDAGPIIKNEPSVSSLLAQSECLVTTPTVISEIRDAVARARIETTLKPFLTLRTPSPEGYRVVTQFAKKTGDFAVLSKADLEIIALAYDIECERNGGDWRLRSTPGQKRMNGSPPKKEGEAGSATPEGEQSKADVQSKELGEETAVSTQTDKQEGGQEAKPEATSSSPEESQNPEPLTETGAGPDPTISTGTTSDPVVELAQETTQLQISEKPEASQNQEQDLPTAPSEAEKPKGAEQPVPQESEEDAGTASDSDSEGWITPSNLKKHQEQDAAGRNPSAEVESEQAVMQVATITTDFALQNVLLQMNLNLLSTNLCRVRHLKTFVLRCHACFHICKDTTKQFCPRCGKPSLTRVSCSTSQNGEFKIHLKKNFQWNTRGDRYSIPKPQAGSANRHRVGGGQGGWGHELILAEDQKEYSRAVTAEKRQKMKDLMDEDYLPSILGGDRQRQGGRPKVGAGRNVNSRKRK